ncbi:TolC family protein [Botrimarina mediterranea]|uniref:Outer membrane efflux protein n=1 Tax=Botrimarina mediterranea TaxID=2528022 RepID=A0A518K833_9BACT|nr:TolC family protein [Botrimarina mediterranea]QDV73951.1 Outer membrane efflux protein [Botrimarina mediterranea]QDV78581.1 Outer membrane efflux protein [Planctomycetes bacterium K2D]
MLVLRFTSLMCVLLAVAGCRSGMSAQSTPKAVTAKTAVASKADIARINQVVYDDEEPAGAEELSPPQATGDAESSPLPELGEGDAELVPPPAPTAPPSLEELTQSVRLFFPVIQEAVAARTIASGETLAAWGAFDHKLEGNSTSQPLDFYQNYWHGLGLKRDTYWGGQTFAGYRVGRGLFEPWYLERETNKGGEFKAGFIAPLAKDRTIDLNRAELWRAELERGRVEPEIRALVLLSVRDATAAYWEWVAAAATHEVAKGVLQLGLDRTQFLERQVELGEKASIDLTDNRRIIVSRQASLVDARRKLEQSAVKLSLYLRDELGRPVVMPIEAATAEFPPALGPEAWGESADVVMAQANRPELEELRFVRSQFEVALRQATNEMLPDIDAGLLVAQDVGEPTSSKRDKSEFELEASVLLSVPLERRKAQGKARQLRGKLAQVRAKTQFAADKIAAESQAAHAALVAAAERVAQTSEGLQLAVQMQTAERRLYELGQSTLFNLNLREQQAAEAGLARVGALFDYHVAMANYAAALGVGSSVDLTPLTPPTGVGADGSGLENPSAVAP